MVQGAESKAPTKVLLPFASGTVVTIELSCHEDERAERPVKTYPLFNAGPDLIRSADCGGEVAYHLAKRNGAIPGERKYTIGYLLQGLPLETEVAGESGGLALALAMYCEMTSLKAGMIAATGHLPSIREGGEVKTVQGLTGKLQGLLDVLEPGARIFIPRGNELDVIEELNAANAQKNIAVYPVSSVLEAVDILQESEVGQQNLNQKGKPWLLLVGILCCFAIGILVWSNRFGKERSLVKTKEVEPLKTFISVSHDKPLQELTNKMNDIADTDVNKKPPLDNQSFDHGPPGAAASKTYGFE